LGSGRRKNERKKEPERTALGESSLKSEAHPVGAAIDRFVSELCGLSRTLPLALVLVAALHQNESNEYNRFLVAHGELVEKTDKKATYNVAARDSEQFRRRMKAVIGARTTLSILPRTFVAALVSQYDCFLSKLLRHFFEERPELIASTDRQLSYSQLKSFESIDAATAFVVEKEIESLLRKSHSEQFKWLESRFGVTLTKHLTIWPTFIELTERRNLFAHCGGVVSSQYLDVCRQHGVDLTDGPALGDQLEVSQDYFEQSFRTILEVGVKLAHVLWRKLCPLDVAAADEGLGGTGYDLIVQEQYDLAVALLGFGETELKTHPSEEEFRRIVVNLAQAHKWAGRNEDCLAALARHDWSAVNRVFKLVVAVLRDEYDEAGNLMRQLGKDGDMMESSYAHWPLFREFRETEQFLSAYEDVFGTPFQEVAEEASELVLSETNDVSA